MKKLLQKKLSRLAIPGISAMVVLAPLMSGLFVTQPARAQQKNFIAKPITGGTTTTASKSKEVRKGVLAPNISQISPRLPAGPCDVNIAPGSSPAGGYLPLSLFGIPPVAGVTDDSITNFTVPAFLFAGDTYTAVGFSSNGYVIIGGSGNPADNSINNQNFPNPTLPNNVLALFWTDLNPAGAGALRIGTLTDGSDTWIVMDWQGVREFSTAGNLHSFQVWIGVNSDANPVEDISYAYGPNTGNGDGGFLSVGAENKFGTHGQNTYFNGTGTLPSNGTQLRVTTTACSETVPPTITCPGSVSKFTDSGQNTATVNPGTATATDNVAVQSVNGVRSDGKALTAPYPIGVTTITWTATDTSGNTAQCTQTIVVMVPSSNHRIP